MRDINLDRFISKKITDITGLLPIIRFDGEGYLTIECSWRVRDSEFILVGCSEYDFEETHKKAHEELISLLLGREISKITFVSPVSDLIIEFHDNLFLELFCDSSIYEGWTLADGNGFEVISTRGGDYCIIGG